MTVQNTYYYAGQFKRYIGQFLRIFSGLQVQDGVDRNGDGIKDFRPVKVVYGNMDRIIEKVFQNNATFTNQKLPIISGYLSGLKRADEYVIPKHHNENVTYQNTADNQYHTIARIPGVPYVISMDLYLYASNTDQMFQLLEQILLWFNPTIDFQRSSSVVDWSYITKCSLVGIQDTNNYPIGTDRRVITQTLNFEFVGWLNYNYSDTAGSIQTIITNIKDSSLVIEDLDLVTPPPASAPLDTTTMTSNTKLNQG